MPVPSAIDHRARGYSLDLAYWLAQASDLAYKDEATIEKQARQWGFETVRHHHTRFTPPFPLEDTQAYTLASDHMIITAFRGTEPAQIRDWLADATTPPWPGPAKTGYVHYGFAQALESVFPTVKKTLEEVRTNGQSHFDKDTPQRPQPFHVDANGGISLWLQESKFKPDYPYGFWWYSVPRLP